MQRTTVRPGSGAWRSLGWFWVVVLCAVAVAAAVLQVLGPPPAPPAPPSRQSPPVAAAPQPAPAVAPAPPLAPPAMLPAVTPGTVAPPDAALLEPSTTFPGGELPRVSAAGLSPMRAYAAPFDPADLRPRVAVLLGGIGMSESESEEAIRNLPGAVSLAVSPYAFRPERLIGEARAEGHELLLSLPLEPAGYPLDDPGNRALLTGNLAALNHQRLEWALTRFTGYAGATGALNGMRGERFAAVPELMDPVLRELAARGLLYIDPRPGAAHPPFVVGRSVDVVIDEPAVRTEIEANLARLEQIARDHGSALGLVGVPRPVTLDRLAAWTTTLARKGLVLAPVSAVVQPPPPPHPIAEEKP